MHRLLKRRNLFALLFAVLLAFPMFSILARTIYVSANKNAKDSYSDTYYAGTTLIADTGSLSDGLEYYFKWNDSITTIDGPNTNRFYYSQISIDWTSYGAPVNNYDAFQIYYSSSTVWYLYLYVNNSNVYTFWTAYQKDFVDFTFTNNGNYSLNGSNNYNVYLFSILRNSLDNAFEYSVNQFIDDNNFGKLDFFQWFDNMFLDSTNSINNMYIHFVNWYLNYALLISLAYILFLVLMWFINYVRKLLEKGMDFGEGSY